MKPNDRGKPVSGIANNSGSKSAKLKAIILPV
jgi:hypothetical protein